MVGSNLRDLTSRSQRIVIGTVTGFRTCRDSDGEGFITSVNISTSQHWKRPGGERTSPSALTIILAGGQIGQLTELVGGTPEFFVGEQAVLFLDRFNGNWRVTADFQGAFSVTPSGQVERLGLPLAAFKAKVRQALKGALAASEDPLAAAGGRVIEPASATSQYLRFPFQWFFGPVQYSANPSSGKPSQLNIADVRNAWTNAHNTWENDPGSSMDFTFLGDTTKVSNGAGCDNAEGNTSDLTWGIPASVPQHDANVLALTYSCLMEAGTIDRLFESDIEFDTDHWGSMWGTSGDRTCGQGHAIDLETVALHETGHQIGLDHPSNNVCTVFGQFGDCPIMNAAYTGILQTLCAGDQKGVAALYPPLGTPTPTPTNTSTPTITPTATPKNQSGDTDGDTVINSVDPDDDNDGCTDVQETGLVLGLGGLRDPHNFWDFFDVWTGAPSWVRNKAIAAPDFFGVLGRFGTTRPGGAPTKAVGRTEALTPPTSSTTYHTAFDRGPAPAGANPWLLTQADGSIAAADFFRVLAQFGHTCT